MCFSIYEHGCSCSVKMFLFQRVPVIFERRSFIDTRQSLSRLRSRISSVSCEAKTRGLDALLHVLGQRRTKALVAVLDSPMCEVTAKLAQIWNIPLFTWTCPLVSSLNPCTTGSWKDVRNCESY